VIPFNLALEWKRNDGCIWSFELDACMRGLYFKSWVWERRWLYLKS